MSRTRKRKLGKNQREVVAYINEFLERVSRGRSLYEREWYTSILFQRGHQWIAFSEIRKTFQQSNIRKKLPRPVTNKFAESASTLVSALLNYDPRITYAPQTGNADDLRSSVGANGIIKSIENEINWQKVRAEAFPWLVLTGNVFVVFGYDPEGGRTIPIKKMHCVNSMYGGECDYTEDVPAEEPEEGMYCPQCKKSGVKSPMLEEQDENGATLETLQPQGCMTAEVINPFELFFDYSLPLFEQNNLVVRIHSKSVQWVKDKWGIKDVPVNLRRRELNARFRTGLHNAAPTGEEAPVDQVDVVEAWCKPCRKYPNGFYMVMLGDDRVMEYQPYSWVSTEGKVYLPIVHYTYERTPGSCYARSPMFDLIEKQRFRNRVEGLGELCLGRTANPVWLIPRGTETDPSGHVGQYIFYDANTTNNQYPRRDDGKEVPKSIVEWLERIDNEMYMLAGIPEITRGERPLSVKTGYGIDKLDEAAKARQSQVLNNIAIATVEAQIAMLEIFRSEAPQERYTKVFGRSAGWTVKKIKDLDLKGGVDIYAEVGGTMPKTHLEKQAQLDLFLKGGLLNPADPMVQFRIFQEYGMEDIKPEISVDLLQIAREHDRFYNEKIPPQIQPWDNHQFHYQFHIQEMKEESFEDLPDQMKLMLWQHAQQHLQFVVQQQAAQIQSQQMGGGQPA